MKIQLPHSLPFSLAALGGDLKCRPAVAIGAEADVLDEIGDLASPEKQDALETALEKIAPTAIVCDRHPGYFSTALAERVAAERGCKLFQVQHHRAHVAAACLEFGLYEEQVIGLAFDGTGYGDDGVAWGGEMFTGSLAQGFARAAHFAPVPLPGGDAAVRAPWRIALALLLERGVSEAEAGQWLASRRVPLVNSLSLGARVGVREPLPASQGEATSHKGRDFDLASSKGGGFELFRAGLNKNVAIGRSTALGRWFDAVSALLGVRVVVDFEAQGAIELQKLAEANAYDVQPGDWPFAVSETKPHVIDFPALPATARRAPTDAPRLAYAFHHAAAAAVAAAAARLAGETGARVVLASGGVFLNRLFDRLLAAALADAGLEYRKPQKLPPGDQAIALGQIGLVLAEVAR
jgi:hydrogenase maturation protein HypF